MFGFLKQKLTDFTSKLKQKAQTETDEKEKQEEKIEEKKEINKDDFVEKIKTEKEEETKKIQQKKEAAKIQEKAKETIQEEKENPLPAKQEEQKKEEKQEKRTETQTKEKLKQKIEEKQKAQIKEKPAEEIKSQEKKGGILGKLFGFGKAKKDETKAQETEKTKKDKQKMQETIKTQEKKKKTKEELAKEMEEKMFKQIENELGEEAKEDTEKELIEIQDNVEEKAPKAEEELTKEKIEESAPKSQKKEIIEEEKIIAETKEKTLEKNGKLAPEESKTYKKEPTEDWEKAEEEYAESVEAEEEKIERKEKPRDIKIKTIEEDKRELKASVGVGGKLKGFLFGGVEISEKDINDLLWELELSLIESDVEQDAASELVKQIKQRLIGQKVSIKQIDEYLKEQIKEILTEMMKTENIDLLQTAKKKKAEKKPFVLLMLGPNGAGKTTSIAKLVHYFKKNNLTSIIAAGDTFRAGAIDQIEEHAKRLNVRVIKQQYGADPAAVAFDAIKAAEAGKIDVVLIDSAGRQETNKNLMEELRKIERVAKPDLRIYVGEAYVGQALLDQVNEFSEIIGIDGFILTKIDTDAKGGTAISLLYKTKKPIIFVGTGQEYDDFKEFTPEFVLERII